MAQMNGDLGWIAAADEDVAYGTAGASLVYQQAISSSLKLKETRGIPPVLGGNAAAIGSRFNTYVEGQVVLGHTDEADEVGLLYNNCASVSTGDYTFGGTPTVDSLSFFADYNGVEYDYTGCLIRGLTWNLANGDYSKLTLDVIGQAVAKYTGSARSTTLPPNTEVIVPGDLGTFTIGGTALGNLKGATINWSWDLTGIGRQRLGSTTMPMPVRTGRPQISAQFTVELDDAAGNNVVAELDDYIADGAPGTIVLDHFSLAGCKFTGDLPDLASGARDVTLSCQATGLVVTTT